MELRQLRYAVAVADHLNFREASRALHVAQPSLKDASEHVDHAFLRTENIIESSVSRRHVTFSQQLQVQEADHPQEIEKTEEEGRKAACGFGEIGENCDFTSPRKRPS